MERENSRLQKRLDELESSPRTEKAENAIRDSIKISELEVINSQLKSQIFELRNSIDDGSGKRILQEQLLTLQNELDRRAEESVQLKSVLANQTDNMKSIVSSKNRRG